ncbi:MAG: hydrogenase iron-sulfur subunit, partial [Thermodesulfobacteriota bacterium]|nr:hydrogenase iron-sulfur subunit [Thermodesulfobacteriota bacterium]
HYINGNFKARRRVKLIKEILTQFGFEPERVKLTWIGASDGIEFAQTITELAATIKKMGPCPAQKTMVL